MTCHYLERIIDLTDPGVNRILNMTAEEARQLLLEGPPERAGEIDGSFALIARQGKIVKMARSLDRPLRYFLAKRAEGPALVVANRIDAIWAWLKSEGLERQFQPAYTRMVPAHHVVEIHLVGCPDPDPVYTRFFTPTRNALPADLERIGAGYIGSLANEIRKWLASLPATAPIGVCFSGGIDSGAVFLVTYHTILQAGMNPSRLKAFTLASEGGEDLAQARHFLEALGLGLFLEAVEIDPAELDPLEAIRVIEDYKALDVESATMSLALFRGIRARYPGWRHLIDGDGGDENLKDYPIEENPELTIRSVLNNRMLYQEGWGLGTVKHSLTYTGGYSRSCVRGYAPARHFGFETFSPFTRPAVIEQAEGIPFLELAGYDTDKLYRLKGEVTRLGIKAVTGLEMPVFSKRRFQHGAIPQAKLRQRMPATESELRRQFRALYP